MPTLARHLNLASSGSWSEAQKRFDEVTINLRDAEKEQLSMPCKLVCAEVLNRLARDNIYSFDGVQSHQWDAWAQGAAETVQAKTWDFKPRWLNPDVVGSKDGFEERKPQIAFPEKLLGTLLAPCNRAGQRYCAEFQSGSCVLGDECNLGLHKCAAVFRGGRTCHRNHAGSECWDAISPAVSPAEHEPAKGGARQSGGRQGTKIHGPLRQWTCHRILWYQCGEKKSQHSQSKR